ncbi:hypothetical protein TRSC58_00309 [Trypanosoma rangeli SC58]|uniref:Uncharacterized protein n=1 Tax=Trypanosoma rangeli SC58 TaxID=429131 RepID=A0A061JEG3_TRYRA|nr:hypothetical protein TRSC58_00309 [Trypanosoma rangeli SC58]
MQEDVQTVRQQRLTQESYHANIELLRMAWEREQRELLQWGHEVMLAPGDSATQPGSTVARTHLPTASTTTEMMERLAERNRAVMEERSKLRARRGLFFHAMEKEHADFVARQRETESCWVQICEQLLDLAAEEETASARQAAVGVEIAKMAAMRELMNHDKELFRARLEEMQEEAERLKRELQATLTQNAEHDALQQQIVAEQTALARKQHDLAIEQSRLETTGVAKVGKEKKKQRLHPAEKEPMRTGRPLSPGKTSLRSFIDVLQEVTDTDNIIAQRGKPHESQRLGREERSTLSHSIVPPSGGRSPSRLSSFVEATGKTGSSA